MTRWLGHCIPICSGGFDRAQLRMATPHCAARLLPQADAAAGKLTANPAPASAEKGLRTKSREAIPGSSSTTLHRLELSELSDEHFGETHI